MSIRSPHNDFGVLPSRVLVLALILTLALPVFAHGAKSEKEKLEDQLEAIRADLKEAGEDYDAAFWRLDETDVRLKKIEGEIAATEAELERSRRLLTSRVARMYRSDAVDYLAVLFQANSFQDMTTRLDYLQRIGNADAEVIKETTALAAKLSREQAALEDERVHRAAAVDELADKKAALEKKLSSKKREYEAVKAKLAAQARSSSGSSSSARAPAGPNGMVFPVQGVCYYSDTWGASRSGGRRSHKGTDIMAPHGTPCVAVLSGTVRTKSNRLGGKTIWLTADNGWQFYYAHLQGYAVSGGRVSAGQTIGYVGSTGNASAGAPHLHFQIHPGGGSAVNPYRYLRQMQ
jgi:murein DD-endopeptidase MepM/ murein hydrolase activator NlpD